MCDFTSCETQAFSLTQAARRQPKSVPGTQPGSLSLRYHPLLSGPLWADYMTAEREVGCALRWPTAAFILSQPRYFTAIWLCED